MKVAMGSAEIKKEEQPVGAPPENSRKVMCDQAPVSTGTG